VKVNVDKTLVASIALHVLVIGWGLVSFSTRAFEVPPEESLPVDIISADQLAKVTAGVRTGDKDKPKPKVEKIADATPEDDAVGKLTEKKELIKTNSTPEPPPKPVEKPVEKKPDPPKPVVENKPKEEQKPQEKKPDPAKEDPIAEAGRREQAEGRAEAAGEEAGSGQGRSDRRGHQETGHEEADAEAGAQGCNGAAAAAAEAQGAYVRSRADCARSRQARSDPARTHRHCAECVRLARAEQRDRQHQRRDLAGRVQGRGQTLLHADL